MKINELKCKSVARKCNKIKVTPKANLKIVSLKKRMNILFEIPSIKLRTTLDENILENIELENIEKMIGKEIRTNKSRIIYILLCSQLTYEDYQGNFLEDAF
jgi:hypothetical protein